MNPYQLSFLKQTLFSLIVAVICVFSTAFSHAQDYPTRSEKQRWEGKLVFEEIDGQGFFESLSLTERLEALVGPSDYARITNSTVATPMHIEDRWLLFWGCIPHSCGDSVRLAMDLDSNKIAVSILHYYLPDQRQKLNVYTQFINVDALPEKVAKFVFLLEER